MPDSEKAVGSGAEQESSPTHPTDRSPHVVIVSTPAGFDPAKLDVGAHKGLLYLVALGGGTDGAGRLLAAWRDGAAYRAAGPGFFDKTGLREEGSWQGPHLATLRPKTRWWQPWRLKAPPEVPADRTPHVVIFSTPAAFHHEEIDVGACKGLLYVEALGGEGDGTGRLLAAWRDRDAYQAARARFLDANEGISEGGAWQGPHLDTLRPKKRWWQQWTPARIWAAVATLFLALAYVEKIRDASGWLIGPPLIETSSKPVPANFLAGEPFLLDVTVRNTRQLGDCVVEFLDQRAEPPNGLVLDQLARRTVPAVKPNGEAILPVTGWAQQEGKYKVVIRARATAGLISSTEEFEAQADVRVWRALEFGTRRVKNTTAGGKLCEAEVDLHVGRRYPLGIEAEAELKQVPGVHFLAVRFPGTSQFTPRHTDEPGKEVATLEWRTPELAPMRTTTFSLILESVANAGKTRDEWEAVVRGILCHFNEAR